MPATSDGIFKSSTKGTPPKFFTKSKYSKARRNFASAI